jgi:3-deoxy-D-manno-octulosonic acid (KDO) 8-phosphate synthase
MPVEISQVFITPSESDVIAIPSFDCRVTDLIDAEEEM